LSETSSIAKQLFGVPSYECTSTVSPPLPVTMKLVLEGAHVPGVTKLPWQ
jgi:hypothetical protein